MQNVLRGMIMALGLDDNSCKPISKNGCAYATYQYLVGKKNSPKESSLTAFRAMSLLILGPSLLRTSIDNDYLYHLITIV